MKVSIDLDGTLYAFPELFSILMHALQGAGHQVGILTGHNAESESHDRHKLDEMGFRPNFYLGRSLEFQSLNGSVFKCLMIRQHNIDVHFDDLDYGNPESTRLFERDMVVSARLFRLPKDHAKAAEHGW